METTLDLEAGSTFAASVFCRHRSKK